MTQAPTRPLYTSRAASFKLPPQDIFAVTADIVSQMHLARDRAVRECDYEYTSLFFKGKDRRFIVATEYHLTPNCTLRNIDLASLVLSDDGSRLELTIQPAVGLVVDPISLYHIGERYTKK